MTRGRKPSIPSYRLYKQTGQAIVCIEGRYFYLGPHGSPGSRRQYDRLISERLASGRILPDVAESASGMTIVELVAAYWRHVQTYYRKDEQPTSEVTSIRRALDPLQNMYGDTVVDDFGPLKLKAYRQSLIDKDLSRKYINDQADRVRRMFAWGVENQLVATEVLTALRAMTGLRKGRSEARETEPVRPVAEEHVFAIRNHVSRQVWAMVQLQLYTGARAGEIVIMRGRDLDTSGTVWTYTPASHKTEHHGKSRVIYLGRRAQAVVKQFLTKDLNVFLFRPDEAMEEHNIVKRTARRTPMTPSHRKRSAGIHPQKTWDRATQTT